MLYKMVVSILLYLCVPLLVTLTNIDIVIMLTDIMIIKLGQYV